MSAKTIERTDGRDELLRLAMYADATISAVAGIAGLAGGALKFDGAPTVLVHGMASFFIAYGAVVFGLAALPTVRRSGMCVIVFNVLYTLAAATAVFGHVFAFTASGMANVSASTMYTFFIAALQYAGWRWAAP